MQERNASFEDPGLAIDPPVDARHPDDVAEVRPQQNYELLVRFHDGTSGVVEMRDLVFGPNAGVFSALADLEEFSKAGVGFGTVMWSNGLDLAPDAMYDALKANGRWQPSFEHNQQEV